MSRSRPAPAAPGAPVLPADAPRLLLVDGRNLLDRHHHARPELRTTSGLPTGGTLGFTQALLQLLGAHQPAAVAVAFDHPEGSARRRALFAGYKAARAPTDPAIREQIYWSSAVAELLGATVLCAAGGEADDVIATLAARAPVSWVVLVASSDKDLLSLLSRPATFLAHVTRGGPALEAGDGLALRRLGVRADQVEDYLALAGDSGDGIPGGPGIGNKTARLLLGYFGSLHRLIEEQSLLGGVLRRGKELRRRLGAPVSDLVGDQLRAAGRAPTGWGLLELSGDLARLDVAVPGLPAVTDLVRRPIDESRLRAVLRELEFDKLLKRMEESRVPA